MKETFSEKEYQEISKLYSREVLKNYYENKDNYIEYDGFKNLNECNLLPKEFELIWKLQELLYTYNQLKEQLSNNFCTKLDGIRNSYYDFFEEEE